MFKNLVKRVMNSNPNEKIILICEKTGKRKDLESLLKMRNDIDRNAAIYVSS
mgnify:FL=1